MRSVESSAKTMEEAVTQGLEKLGVSFADVKIDILDEGSKGFLGILGGKPVVVRLTVREDAAATEDVLSSVALEDAVKEPEQKPARKRKPKADKPEDKVEKPAAQEKADQPKAPKAEKPEAKHEKPAKPAKAEKPPRAEKPVKAEKPAAPAAEAAQPPADKEAPEGRAFTFLTDVTRLMGVEVTINARRDEEGNVRVDMFGDTLGILIGRRGETLDALQYLTSLYVNKGSEDYIRVTLDTENYRAKREEALRKLAGSIAKTNCVVIFINQLRMKIGVMYGNPETTTGGNALKFYASVRLDVRRVESIKNGSDVIGNRTRVRVVKNKVAPPFREAVFDIMYGEGISRDGEVLDLAVKLDIIQKSGSWFSYNGERMGQGKDNARKYLEAHPELMEEVERMIKSRGDQIDLAMKEEFADEDNEDEDGEEAFSLNAIDIEGE